MRVKSARAQKATSMSAAMSRSGTDEPTADFSPAAVRDLGAGGETPVRVCGLVKRFGRFRALDGLDLTVEAGSVHGFLGPNGAGKSTTIRVLLGLYRPDGGSVSVLGSEPWRQAALINRQVSYVPGDVALWPALTGGQVLDALAGLRGSRDAEREAELIERFDLDPSKRVRTYSKGNRQKVALVAALAAPTSLLVLDEPNNHLDLEAIIALGEALYNFAGCAICVSHDRELIDAFANRILHLKGDAEIVDFRGTYEEYRESLGVSDD